MIKRLFIIVLLIFVIGSIYAIEITEFESNPEGTDSGNEWIELYNEEEISLEGYKIVNNDGDEIDLNETFSGYYVYTFNQQWLDNSNEKIFLYRYNESVDETELFKDDKDNDFTWQLCEDWEFLESTKGEENNCEAPNNILPNNQDNTEEDNDKNIIEDKDNSKDKNDEEINNSKENLSNNKENEPENIELEPINLSPKNINSSKNASSSGKTKYVSMFASFCILLVILFILKSKSRKNELE